MQGAKYCFDLLYVDEVVRNEVDKFYQLTTGNIRKAARDTFHARRGSNYVSCTCGQTFNIPARLSSRKFKLKWLCDIFCHVVSEKVKTHSGS